MCPLPVTAFNSLGNFFLSPVFCETSPKLIPKISTIIKQKIVTRICPALGLI